MQQLWERNRLKVGWTLMVLSLVPWGIASAIPFTDLSVATAAAAVTGLLILAEVIFAAAILVLGRTVWQKFKDRFKTAPSREERSDQETWRPRGE